MGVPPVIIHFSGMFHEINHLFWGIPICGTPHMALDGSIRTMISKSEMLATTPPWTAQSKAGGTEILPMWRLGDSADEY